MLACEPISVPGVTPVIAGVCTAPSTIRCVYYVVRLAPAPYGAQPRLPSEILTIQYRKCVLNHADHLSSAHQRDP